MDVRAGLIGLGLVVVACGGKATEQRQPPGASGNGTSMPNGGSDAGGTGSFGEAGQRAAAGTGASSAAGDASYAWACETYHDCPPADCASCANTPGGCPPSNCVMGQCFHDSCASIDACYGKMCGDACQACYGDDGVCTAGTCDRFGDCTARGNSCDTFAPLPCDPHDARGAGFVNGKTCNNILGWAWGGTKCVPVVGCVCAGSDCRSLLQTETDCSGAYYTCVSH